jgi:hypothetical protein
MQPGRYDFSISASDDFSRTLAWTDSSGTPINLTGYTAACQVRDERGELLVDFLVDGLITINGSAGTVTLVLPGSFTSTLSFDSGNYDLFLIGPADTGPTGAPAQKKLIRGVVTLAPSETVT